MIPYIREKQDKLEKQYIEQVAVTDEKAQKLYSENKDEALDYLTNFSVAAGKNTFKEWQQLYRFLFTRYMDGNVKTPVPGELNPELEQPGYGESWYRRIVNETGDKFLYHGETSH